MKNPKWWTEEHTSTWDRVKDAMKRDWEQTKADFSKTAGKELDQSAGDTVKQAAGKEAIPGPNTPNPKPMKETDWDHAAGRYRYGVGARKQYGGADGRWDDRLEGRLASEWKDLEGETTWDEAKANVRRGYERGR
jgi:hypothetical protein